MKSSILRIILAVVIVILGYFIYTSIEEPIKFKLELQRRNEVVIAKLIDIRTSEILFKQIYNRYTGSFDTLVEFLKKGKIPKVMMVAKPQDTKFLKYNNDAIGFISIADSLFGKKKDYNLEDIALVPFSSGAKFLLASGRVNKDGVSVAVFEASTPYEVYLKGIDNDLITKMVKDVKAKNKFPGLRVGSLNEASTAGNWE